MLEQLLLLAVDKSAEIWAVVEAARNGKISVEDAIAKLTASEAAVQSGLAANDAAADAAARARFSGK